MKKRSASLLLLACFLPALSLALETEVSAPVTAITAEDIRFLSLTREPSVLGNLPTNLSVINAREIKETGAETLDQVVDRLPGVDVQRTGTMGTFAPVRIRGVPSSSETQLVIDDMPVGGVSLQFIDLARIPVESIDRIEIVRGGSSVLYGANTIGGVIHVITKKRTEEGAAATLGYQGGSYDTNIFRASAGGMAHRADAFATFTRYTTDGFQHNGYGQDTSGTLNAGYSFGNGARIGLETMTGHHESGNPKGTTLPIEQWNGDRERDPADPTAYSLQDNTLARVRGEAPLGDAGTVKSMVFLGQQYYKNYPGHGQQATFDQDNRILGNDTRFHFFNGLTVGGSYQRDEQDTEGSIATHVTDLGGYLQQEITLDRVRLIPAVRYDHHSEFGGVTNPRFTAVVDATPWWSISTNIARSFRAPSFLELFFKDPFFNGNPDLKPERAWTYDLGNRFRVGGQEVSVTGFFTRIDDRIAPTLVTYENIAKAEIRGVEIETMGRFGPFRQRVNYTALAAIGSDGAASEFVPLRLTPRQTANASLTWEPGRYSLTNEVRYVGEQLRLDDKSGVRLPAYAVWNARAGVRVAWADLAIGVDNILEERYGESFDNDASFSTTINPQPGRTYWGSASVQFGR